MPSPRHNTTKAFPAVAKGYFRTLEDVDDLELGDVVYVPEYFSCSVSTLRSGGLSVGDTYRSENRQDAVKKIFGPGHKAMYLVAADILRRNTNAPTTLWSRGGMVLPPANRYTPAGLNQITAEPGKPPIHHVSFVAIPAESFRLKTVAEAVATSPAVCLLGLRAAADEKLVARFGGALPRFFAMRNDGRGSGGGIPRPGDNRDPGTWLIHAILDYAQRHSRGVDGTVDTEAWQQKRETDTEPDCLTEVIRDRYLVESSIQTDTLDVYNRDCSTPHMRFLRFLKCHKCTFLRRNGFWDNICDQMAREMADQTVKRVVKTLGIFQEFLPAAVEGAFKRLGDLADAWTELRDGIDPENYTDPASALAEAEPSTRYGVRRGK